MNPSHLTENLLNGINTAVSTPSATAVYYLLGSSDKIPDAPLLVITKSDSEARRLADELGTFFTGNVLWFPKRQLTFHDLEAESADMRAYRLKAVNAVMHEQNSVIVTSLEGLMTPLSDIKDIKETVLNVGDTLETNNFSEFAASIGYEHVSIVDGKGQLSIRGGIIDIFPPYLDEPVRIELFDNEIDSIRTFDVISQRSLEKIKQVRIMPASEYILPENCADKMCGGILADMEACSKGLSTSAKEKLSSRVSNITSRISSGAHSVFYKNYTPYISDKRFTIADYCANCKILFIEPELALADYELYVKGCHQRFADMLEHGEVLPGQIRLIPETDEVISVINSRTWLCVKEFQSAYKHIVPQELVKIEAKPVNQYSGNFEALMSDIIEWRKNPVNVFMFTGNEKRALLLKQHFSDNGISPVIISNLSEAKARDRDSNGRLPLFIVKDHLSEGCVCEDAVLIGDSDIFGAAKKTSHAKRSSKPIKSFTDLTIGSYVVHETHGIARFLGIQANEISGKKQDYLVLEYAGSDKIYVPVDRLDFIQPYVSTDGAVPALSRLGGKEWGAAKEKASASIKKLAYDLVELYARREVYKGFKYSPDTVWQKELEDSFMYEETEDQLRAVEEIKRDMEDYKIMDRLLCGDVGFGKTEVAVRAAFKAVMDSKQVAVLAPTTILAQQHFQTFSERFAHFPVKVDVVSRFRSASEQKKTLKALENGDVDVLIGTHRLLSNDVHFKDLGLLIVDEEQRFGVNHKEKIKNIKKNVDVLTLSATPIPRTLHMSLVGIRDISIIDTPPRDRFPIQTYVIEDNDDIVRDAILRELDRDGQVFFLYNNVTNIDKFKIKLSNLVPEARIAVAHGQMSESQLERVMMGYFNHDYDVLLCSTIIESGIDIPNANTLFVYDADKLGLSQLYQIRGRIGRSTRTAYAYLMYREDKVLTDIAAKRLKAIKDFTELGSGFRIAMRDLEIRGAGNVIGSEQSGHMTNIGYDLYCKMLSDEIAKLQGKTSDDPIEVTISVSDEAYIPADYITEEEVRLEMYKKISLISSKEDKYKVEEEIEDRYSDMPKQVYNLTNIAYLRSICRKAKITSVKQKNEKYEFTFCDTDFNPASFGKADPKHKIKLDLDLKGKPKLILSLPDTTPAQRLNEIVSVSEELFN